MDTERSEGQDVSFTVKMFNVLIDIKDKMTDGTGLFTGS